jgi:cytochrome c-type biogenesis protein CcmF
VIGGSLGLYAWRAPTVGLGGKFSASSRESLLLVNNVLLLAAAAAVFLGTLYPLFLDALNLGKISVGPPYFETVFVPLMLPMLLLMAIGPFMRWKSAPFVQVIFRLRWVALVAILTAVATRLILEASPMVIVGETFAAWILLATASHLIDRLRHASAGTSLWRRLRSQPRSYWGMLIAHAGVGIFVLGVTMVKGTETSNDVNMRVGDTTSAGGYVFRFASLQQIEGPNYTAMRGTFDVTRDGAKVTTMTPEKRMFTVQQMPMTEAAIDRGFTRDLYVSLGEPGANGTWVVRVQHKPFVSWIWAGCLTIAFGGFFAVSDRRYRLMVRKSEQAFVKAGPIMKVPT